mgnify:CR=1 FL=1
MVSVKNERRVEKLFFFQIICETFQIIQDAAFFRVFFISDLFIQNPLCLQPAIKTYNPMIAMMLQSIVLVVFIPLFKKNTVPAAITGIAVLGFSWRALFLGNIAINHALTGFNFSQLASTSNMVQFVLILGLIEAAVLGVIAFLRYALNQRVSFVFKPNIVLALSTFIFAVVLTVFL